MRKKIGFILTLMLLCSMAAGCAEKGQKMHRDEYRYVIGVSVPNVKEPWLKNMIEDIKQMVSRDYQDTNLIFKDATDDVQTQKNDIGQLMDSGIDLLIMAPVDSYNLSLSIAETFQDIPIVVVGISPGTDQYTSCIKYDDQNIGRDAGQYILDYLYTAGDKMVVLKGRDNSPISENRLEGFMSVVKGKIPEDDISYYNGEWIKDKAEDRMKDYLVLNEKLDIVFAFNDEMAYGAYIATEKFRVSDVDFVGVGGFEGKIGGKELVEQGILKVTVSSPGIGKEVIQTAQRILDGRKVEKNILIPRALITQ